MTDAKLLQKHLTDFCSDFRQLEEEIGRVLVGQKEVIRSTIIALIARGHVLLEGVPGLGKTLLVRTLAEALEGKYSRIQFTPDLMPADLTGTNILGEDEHGRRCFEFQPGPLFANIVLADEINRATPKTQAALLEAMQEHSVTVAGSTHCLNGIFFVLATQNPLEMEGTYPLPEAQLDRFFAKILVPFPSENEMLEILRRTTVNSVCKVTRSLSESRIQEMGTLAREVLIADEIEKVAVKMILRTHPDNADAPERIRRFVRYGASPRGAQALLLGAKINALLDGRCHVSRDDLFQISPMVLRHRLILNFEGHAENIKTDLLIKEIF